MKLLRKKWSWTLLFIILIFSIIIDLVILNAWAVYTFANGEWDMRLLGIASVLIISDIISSISKKWKLQTGGYTRIAFFLLVLWTISIHGFLNGLVFMSLVLILSRMLRLLIWIGKRIVQRFRRRGLLEEV